MKKYTTRFLILVLFLWINLSYGITTVTTRTSRPSKSIIRQGNIKICALRVEFQEDDKDVTSGTGKFLYEAETHDTLNSRFKVDPVPHNRAYFKDHIRSLANFYNHVSTGQLTIDLENSEVYPLTDEETYTVSQEMDYYHPFLEEDSIDIRLAELFIEAVELADEDINFADYDVVVIFHAGVGQDFAFDLDPTPYDIPSVYLNGDDIAKAVNADNFNGIAVDNGETRLAEGIILPETQNHTLYENWEDVFGTDDGFDYQIGLNGTFSFQFGFYLGMPGMYNTETGDAGIGRWGMMDQGSVNLNGLVPAIPNAWIREFMGWITPAEATEETKVSLVHAESNADTLAWKVNIDDDEYFLVENRCNFLRPGWNLDSIRNARHNILTETDSDAPYPSVLPLIKDSINAEISEETGVLLSVPRYDYGLPGSGLLIWHIDESVIDANLSTNSVNNDRNHRGVDMMEADGAKDIGFPPVNMFSDVHNGWGFDAWFAKNEGFWDINKKFYEENDTTFIGFTDYTFPNTKSNDNVYTGIRIDSIGNAGETMTFTLAFDNKTGKFPLNFEAGIHEQAVGDFNNDGNDEIVILSDKIDLYTGNGQRLDQLILYDDSANDFKIAHKGNTLWLTYQDNSGQQAAKIMIDDQLNVAYQTTLEVDEITSNLMIDFNQAYAGCRSGENYYFYRLDSKGIMNSQIDEKIIRIFSDKNNIFTITQSGIINQTTNDFVSFSNDFGDLQGVAAGFLDDNNDVDIAVTSEDDLLLIKNITSNVLSMHVEIKAVSPPILTPINGKNMIVLADTEKVYAFDENLNLTNNFPVSIPNNLSDKKFGSTLLSGNLDQTDPTVEIITAIEEVGLLAFNEKGKVLSNFPVATKISKNPSLYNYAGNSYFISTVENQVISTKVSEYPLGKIGWSQFGQDGNDYFYDNQPTAETPGNDALLIKKKTFCWPNPIESGESKIRYSVSEACDVSINIFNMAGQFISSFNDKTPEINSINEVKWNISAVESGVYYAIVKAEKGSKSERKTIKIMVIK